MISLPQTSDDAGDANANEGGESGDAFEIAAGDRARRHRRLDDRLSTCPEAGSTAPSVGWQSVEKAGEVREPVLHWYHRVDPRIDSLCDLLNFRYRVIVSTSVNPL